MKNSEKFSIKSSVSEILEREISWERNSLETNEKSLKECDVSSEDYYERNIECCKYKISLLSKCLEAVENFK